MSNGLRAAGVAGPVPADAATASGSGLDPDISPEFAPRRSRASPRRAAWPKRRLPPLVERFTEGRLLGIFGEPRVNVLRLNLALDAPKS